MTRKQIEILQMAGWVIGLSLPIFLGWLALWAHWLEGVGR